MNWKDFFIHLITLVGVVYFFTQSLSNRVDSIDSRMNSIESSIDSRMNSIESSIKELANEIRADRRAMNQRTDNLYFMHAKKEK